MKASRALQGRVHSTLTEGLLYIGAATMRRIAAFFQYPAGDYRSIIGSVCYGSHVMKYRNVIKTLARGVMGAAALSTLVALAAPAHASGVWSVDTLAASGLAYGAGVAEFYADGEILYIYDSDPDGHGPEAWLELVDTNGSVHQYGPYVNTMGYNTRLKKDLAIPEGWYGQLHVCMMSGSTQISGTCNYVSVHS